MTYKILDLFCGAGGASAGYHNAGFEVIGIDISKQPHYPYEFIQGDAIEYLREMIAQGIAGIDAVHASPPCQRWSVMTTGPRNRGLTYPELIEPVRVLLDSAALPYIIENVPGAPLINPVMLCGSHFGLTAELGEYGTVALRRHRLFEANFYIADPGKHDHSLPTITVLDGSGTRSDRQKFGHYAWKKERQQLMGNVGWMTRHELAESIPPAYTEYVGKYLTEHLTNGSADQ